MVPLLRALLYLFLTMVVFIHSIVLCCFSCLGYVNCANSGVLVYKKVSLGELVFI